MKFPFLYCNEGVRTCFPYIIAENLLKRIENGTHILIPFMKFILMNFSDLSNVFITGEAQQWHSKFDAESAARLEEIEEIRRKYTVRIQEQEEHIESLLVKVNNLEKQKSRFQSEIEVLIIDLERANGTARELQKRVDTLERTSIELKTRLEETIQLYDVSQRDLRNKQAELTRVSNELDKTRDQRDGLARDNKKLAGNIRYYILL